MAGCSAGMAVLNGGRGGAAIPDGDREGVHAHLGRHLSDDGRDVPDLAALDDEDADAASDDEPDDEKADGDVERKYGRVLSKANETKLRDARDALDAVLASLGDSASTTRRRDLAPETATGRAPRTGRAPDRSPERTPLSASSTWKDSHDPRQGSRSIQDGHRRGSRHRRLGQGRRPRPHGRRARGSRRADDGGREGQGSDRGGREGRHARAPARRDPRRGRQERPARRPRRQEPRRGVRRLARVQVLARVRLRRRRGPREPQELPEPGRPGRPQVPQRRDHRRRVRLGRAPGRRRPGAVAARAGSADRALLPRDDLGRGDRLRHRGLDDRRGLRRRGDRRDRRVRDEADERRDVHTGYGPCVDRRPAGSRRPSRRSPTSANSGL